MTQDHVYGTYKLLRNVSNDESDQEAAEEDKESNHAISSMEEDDQNKTTNLQTFCNIFNANQGATILAMPYVVKSGGYMALFSIQHTSIAFISNFTNKILVQRLYEYSPEQIPGHSEFETAMSKSEKRSRRKSGDTWSTRRKCLNSSHTARCC